MSSVKMSADLNAEIKSSNSCPSSAEGLLLATAAVDGDDVLLLLPSPKNWCVQLLRFSVLSFSN